MLPNMNPARGLSAIRSILRQAKLDLNFARDEVLDPRITFSRTSNATRTNAQGLIEYAPHNLLTYSEQFDNASWTKNTATVSTNYTTAPDSTTTADLITSTGADGYFGRGQSGISGNQQYTASIYLRSDIPTTIRLYLLETVGGSSSNYTICNITAQWQRFSVSITTASTVTSISTQVGGASTFGTGKAIYAWGAQLNIGSLQPYCTTSVKNLLGYSQDFSNAAWTKSNSSIDATPVMGPFGYLGAMKLVENTVNGSHGISQGVPTIGLPITYSFYAKAGERSKINIVGGGYTAQGFTNIFNLATGTLDSNAGNKASITSVGAGWYRCAISFTPSTTTGLSLSLLDNSGTSVYTGDGTSGVYIFGAQLSDSASLDPYVYNFGAAPTSSAYYGPRVDYDPVTLAPKGLLIEESRTNLLTYSEQFDNAAWAKTNATVTANAVIAPDGTLTADKLVENTSNAWHYTSPAIVSITAQAYTITVFAKLAERSVLQIVPNGAIFPISYVNFDLSAGTVSASSGVDSASITPVGNGLYRCVVTDTATSASTIPPFYVAVQNSPTAARAGSYTGDGTSGIYIWGAQLEAGAFPTSYIPTTSAQVTRAADNASMTGTNFSSWYNQSEGTIYSEWILGGDNTSVNVYNINDNTGANYIRNRYNSAGSGNDNAVGVGGIVQVVLNATNQTTTYSAYKNAMSYKQNDFARSSSGTLITNASGNIPTVSQINIGSSVVFGAEVLNGHLKSFKFFSKRFINTYLQRLTQ